MARNSVEITNIKEHQRVMDRNIFEMAQKLETQQAIINHLTNDLLALRKTISGYPFPDTLKAEDGTEVYRFNTETGEFEHE